MHFSYAKIKKIIINEDVILIDLIKNLNQSGLKIALIVNSKKELVGTATDGDVRRALISGHLLNKKIKNIINKNPITALKKITSIEANNILTKHDIKHLPILHKKKVISMYASNNLVNKIYPVKKNRIIIMAGGFGRRLKKLTKTCPKALLRYQNIPLIDYVIFNAKNYGFRNFIVTVFFLKNKIKQYLGKEKKFKDLKIKFIEEKKPMGTIGSISLLRNINKDFIVLNCDVITNVNLYELLDFHKKNNCLLTMAVKYFRYENPYGVVRSKKNRFLSFVEKPSFDFSINAGIYVFSNKLIKIIKQKKLSNIEDIINYLVSQNKDINLFPIYENWNDLGSNIKKLKKF